MANDWEDITPSSASEWEDVTGTKSRVASGVRALSGGDESVFPEAKPEAVDTLTAAGRGAAQGATMRFGDELNGLVQAALSPLLKETPSYGPQYKPFWDQAREYREASRREDEAAQKAHPYAYGGAELMAAAPAAGALTGAAAPVIAAGGTPAYIAAASTGAGLGAIEGVGGSRAEMTGEHPDIEGLQNDALLGLSTGGIGGVGGQFLASVLPEAAQKLGIWGAKKAISGGPNAARMRKALTDEAAEEALKSGAVKPLSSTGAIHERLEGLTEQAGQKEGDIIRGLEASGVEANAPKELAAQFRQEVAHEPGAAGGASPKHRVFSRWADILQNERTPVTQSMDAAGLDLVGTPSNMSLTQQEALKRIAQQEARREYLRIPGFESPEGTAEMAAASKLRQSTEDAIAAQAGKNPELAAAFVPAKQKYANLAQALGAARIGANKAEHHAALTLPETMTLLGSAALGDVPEALKGAGLAIGHHLIKGRGPSTLGWGSYGLGRAMKAAREAAPGLAPGMGAVYGGGQ